MPQTLTEKVVQRYAVGLPDSKKVKSGDFVTISPHRCMTHDNSWPVATKFAAMGASTLKDPHQIVMTLDHNIQNKSEENLKKYRQIEEFAETLGCDFYPAGRGIGHQIMVEQGYAWPGTLVVASDSHSNMYGGVGCLGTPVVRTDAASIWATGKTWWQVPPVARIVLKGTLQPGVTGKDVIVALCGLFDKDQVLNHALEFTGSAETLRSLSVDARLTIANMTTEWGALSGLFPIDDSLRGWLRSKATMAGIDQSHGRRNNNNFTHEALDRLQLEDLASDKGAKYAQTFYLDLSTLPPYVAGPNSVKITAPLRDVENQSIKVDKAYLLSCTNSRASDIAAAAKVFREAAKEMSQPPRVAQGINFYIAAASSLEQQAAEGAGDWQILIQAGAQPLPAGCGPCIGLGTGLLEAGEVGISATNRNFKGRMGSTEAKAYLASPEVVAASALKGKISGPGWYQQSNSWTGVAWGQGDGVREEDRMITAEQAIEKVIGQLDEIVEEAEDIFGSLDLPTDQADILNPVYPGFPDRIEGDIVFCDGDNINTDGIYPGKLTYADNVSEDIMAQFCMRNYDPEFSRIAKEGDILVSGFNFGCGSSREQAATAILAKKIPLVVAGSFGNIFSRNSINNALMGLEVPSLIQRLRKHFSQHPSPSAAAARSEGLREPENNKQSLDSPPTGQTQPHSKLLTRRTGWRLTWDVRRNQVQVHEGPEGPRWTEKVGELPPNVQEIIAEGGLRNWVKKDMINKMPLNGQETTGKGD